MRLNLYRMICFCMMMGCCLSVWTVSADGPEPTCHRGYVINGGDTTPPERQGGPRVFRYELQRLDHASVTVQYRALPPSPAGQRQFDLAFHAGTVQIGDFMEACGHYDEANRHLTVSRAGHRITTHPATTVIVVRHAEKASPVPNTNLAPAGLARAQALAIEAAAAGVDAVYTTAWCRTAQTGQPTAQTLNLPLFVLPEPSPAGGIDMCAPAIEVPTQLLPQGTTLAAHVPARHRGETVLVVGHSNSVPELVAGLTGRSVCPEHLPLGIGQLCHIPEQEFDHLFTVHLPVGIGEVLISHRRYGN